MYYSHCLHLCATAFICFILLGLYSCQDIEREPRRVRGHTVVLNGISHGIGLNHAPRYCHGCHGPELVGGMDLEPSCYTCHGRNWQDDNKETVHAPVDHNVSLGGWQHHPGYEDPHSNCTVCHSEELNGNSLLDIPSCYLCHDQNW